MTDHLSNGFLLLSSLPILFYILFRIFYKKSNKLFTDRSLRHTLKIVDKQQINHDTILLKISLPSADQILGLPVGNCIKIYAEIDGEQIDRKYTPISHVKTKGSLDLLIKVYHANVHPKFPAGGKMTQYLDQSDVGDYITFDGPHGRMEYLGKGSFKWNDFPAQHFSRVLMIAGGSGITPMFQILESSLGDRYDTTKFCLIYANKSVKDILLHETLIEKQIQNSPRFKLNLTVDELKEDENDYVGSVGFITEELIRESCPQVGDNVLVIICGPPPMINFACVPALKKLGVNNKLIYVF